MIQHNPPGSNDHTAAVSSPMMLLQPGEIVELQAGVGGVDFSGCGVPPNDCPADLNDDGEVGNGDLVLMLGAWGPCDKDCPEDLNDNGSVDSGDVVLLLCAWGDCPK